MRNDDVALIYLITNYGDLYELNQNKNQFIKRFSFGKRVTSTIYQIEYDQLIVAFGYDWAEGIDKI